MGTDFSRLRSRFRLYLIYRGLVRSAALSFIGKPFIFATKERGSERERERGSDDLEIRADNLYPAGGRCLSF